MCVKFGELEAQNLPGPMSRLLGANLGLLASPVRGVPVSVCLSVGSCGSPVGLGCPRAQGEPLCSAHFTDTAMKQGGSWRPEPSSCFTDCLTFSSSTPGHRKASSGRSASEPGFVL